MKPTGHPTPPILSIIDSLGLGGAQHHLVNLCRGLSGGSVSTDVFSLHRRGDLFSREIALSGTRVYFGAESPANVVPILLRLVSLIKANRYRLLHLYLEASTLIGSAVGRMMHTPEIVTTVCGRREQFGGFPLAFANYGRLKGTITKYITTVPEELTAIGIPPEKILFSVFATDAVHTGSLDTAPRPPDSLPGVEGHFPVLLTIGRLIPEKGIAHAIDALAGVVAAHPTARLVVVGAGPDLGRLMRRAEARGMKDRVVFCGMNRNLSGFFSNATVYLNTACHEGVNLSHLQALAHGVPTIKCGTNPVGYMGPNFAECVLMASPDSLTDAILMTCKDGELRRAMGVAGRAYATHYLSLDPVGTYTRLYRSLLHEA